MDVDEIGVYLETSGLSDEEIDKALAHFGVPGMKWGVRRQAQKNKVPTKTERKKALYDVARRDADVQRRVATGAAFIATNIIASGIAKKAGLNKKFVASAVVIGTASVNSMMRVHGAKRLASI